MSLFVIADLHLSFGASKPMDIFDGWENHVSRLETNWQAVVKPDDTVVIPGDFSWAMKLNDTLDDFKFLQRLNGRKILSKGNHDLWWSSVTKIENFFKANDIDSVSLLHNNFYPFGEYGICGTRGWASEEGEPADQKVLLREAGRLEASITAAVKSGYKPIVFLHYPPVYIYGENKPMMAVLKRYNIKECFYGHIHGKKKHSLAVKGEHDGINYHLISSDYLQFMPLNIDKFVQSYE